MPATTIEPHRPSRSRRDSTGAGASKITPLERALLEAAGEGDEDAFRRLVEPLRPAVFSRCHGILGSVHDAEDATQEAMLRAWRGLAGFEGRSSLCSWLLRIATNVCFDAIKRRFREPRAEGPEVASLVGECPSAGGDPGWIGSQAARRLGVENDTSSPEARSEQREAVELALTAAHEVLPVRQRAALILREMLGFSAKEAAALLDTSVASINSALQRARARVEQRGLEDRQQRPSPAAGHPRVRKLIGRLTAALDRGDIDAFVAIVAQDHESARAGNSTMSLQPQCSHTYNPSFARVRTR
jgi:RNA polymerase sigma-70 factor (ECF subfamily)